MRIQHNITAMNSYRNFSTNNSQLSKNLEKLSSGYKINRAGDDAAGLAISEKMRAQITGLEGATKNAKDGISLIQTAEGALTEVHSMLNRMVTLTEQSANGTYDNDVDRAQLQKEVDALKTEIDRVADSTNFNGLKLLDGSLSGTKPAEASTVSGNIEGMTLDATKAKTEIDFRDLDTANLGTDADEWKSNLDGTKVNLSLTMSDGSGKNIELTFAKTSSGVDILDSEGNTLNSVAIANGDATDGKALKDAITDSFRKAIKNDETLGAQFTAGIEGSTAGAKKLTLEAKTEGEKGLTVKSADLTASKGTNKVAANDGAVGDMFNASNATAAAKTVSKTAIQPKVTVVGRDAVTGFKAEDITLYNDNYVDANDGHKGNADKAVFEVNGQKFAIGTSNQTRANLDADVHFISLKGDDDASDAIMTYTEEIGKTNEGKASSGEATAQSRYLGEAAMKQIADEISKVTGVKVEFNNVDYIDNSSTFDGGEKLQGKQKDGTTDISATNTPVPVFTVGKKEATEGKSLTLQIGDTSDDFNKMSVSVADMHVEALGIKDIDISTQEGAAEALTKIKDAVNSVSDTRGGLGALQNRLDHTINNLGVMRENIQNAESLIRDTDVAEEMMTYTKNSILNQSAQAMLAQANQLPQGVLQLLG